MADVDWSSLRRIRQKLSCSLCFEYVNNPYNLAKCCHYFCSECVQHCKAYNECPLCHNRAAPKDIVQSRFIGNIVQAFEEFYSLLLVHEPPAIANSSTTPAPPTLCPPLQQQQQQSRVVVELDVSPESQISPRNAVATALREVCDEDDVDYFTAQDEGNEIPSTVLPMHNQNSNVAHGNVKVLFKSKQQENDNNCTFFCDDLDYDYSSPFPLQAMSQSFENQESAPPIIMHEDSLIPSQNITSPRLSSYPLTLQGSCNGIVNQIDNSKLALELLMRPKLTSSYSLSLPTTSPLASLTQSNTFNNVEQEIMLSKQVLRVLLESKAPDRIAEPNSLKEPSFQWNHWGLPVIAEFSSLGNLLLFEDSCKKGWISCTNEKLDPKQTTRLLITEIVVEEQDDIRLVRRTIQYMKCLLLGFQIVDFSWLKESLNAGHVLNPSEFEVQGTNQDEIYEVPQKVRALLDKNDKLQLLSNYEFSILNDSISPKIKAADIEFLILASGGVIKQNEVSSSGDGKTLIVLSLRLKPKVPKVRAISQISNMVVSVSWLFDFICNFREPNDDLSQYFICHLSID